MTWKLDLRAPTNDNGISSRLSPVPYDAYTKRLVDLISNGSGPVLTLADDGPINKTANDSNTSVTIVQKQLEQVSQWCQEAKSDISPSRVKNPMTHRQQQSSRTETESTNSLGYLGSLLHNAHLQHAGHRKRGCEKDSLVGCLTSQQHASVSQGRICSDNFTCYHTEIKVADQTFHLTQSISWTDLLRQLYVLPH